MQVIPHPPPISPQITHRQRMRFVVVTTAQVNAPITYAGLLDALLVAITATAGKQLFDHVKVNFVEVWYAPAQASSSQVAVEFAGVTVGSIGDGKVWSDNSMGVEPAHVKAKPQRMSQSAQWQPTSSNTAFFVTLPIGSVIDVDCSYRTVTSVAPAFLGQPLVAATAGEIYYRGLDQLGVATSVFTPQAAAIQ